MSMGYVMTVWPAGVAARRKTDRQSAEFNRWCRLVSRELVWCRLVSSRVEWFVSSGPAL